MGGDFGLRCGQFAEPPTQASGRMAPSKTERWTRRMNWQLICLPKTNSDWKHARCQLKGAHTITTSEIFLDPDKKVEGLINTQANKQGERRTLQRGVKLSTSWLCLCGAGVPLYWGKDSGEVRLVAQQYFFLWSPAFLVIFQSLSSPSVSSQSFASSSSNTLHVLMCVQEKKASAGQEGKSENRPDFPLCYPPLPPLWWHSFFSSWWEPRTIVDKAESQTFFFWVIDVSVFENVADFN